jgi:hypothetical protein
MDNLSEPPRELQLCERCWTLTQGEVVLNIFRETGESEITELDAGDEELLMQVGQMWEQSFLESMDAKALAEAEAEADPEALRGIAHQLDADATRFGRKLSRAQTRFVRKHLGRAG